MVVLSFSFKAAFLALTIILFASAATSASVQHHPFSELFPPDQDLNFGGYDIKNVSRIKGEVITPLQADIVFEDAGRVPTLRWDNSETEWRLNGSDFNADGNNIEDPNRVDGVDLDNPGNALVLSSGRYAVDSNSIGNTEINNSENFTFNGVNLNADLDLGNNQLTSVGGTECAANEYIGGDGNCHSDSTSSAQTLSVNNNSAGRHDTITISGGNQITIRDDFEANTDNQDLQDILSQDNSVGSYEIDLNNNNLDNAVISPYSWLNGFSNTPIIGHYNNYFIGADEKWTITSSDCSSGEIEDIFDNSWSSDCRLADSELPATVTIDFNQGNPHSLTNDFGKMLLYFTYNRYASTVRIERYYTGGDDSCSSGNEQWNTLYEDTSFSGSKVIIDNLPEDGDTCRYRLTVDGSSNFADDTRISSWNMYIEGDRVTEGGVLRKSGDTMYGDIDMSNNAIIDVDWANSDNPDTTIPDDQTLSTTPDVSGTDDQISISDGNSITIDDDFEANTDSQTLGTNANQITLTNGGSVTAPYANNADQLDGVQLANIDWADVAMATSDVSKGDVGLGNVLNIDQSTMAGSQLSWDGANNEIDLNQGPGSGLDADTIDTIDSGSLCQSDGTNCPADNTGTDSQNLFETISASSGTNPVADSATETLSLSGGTAITVTGDGGTDTVTIDNAGDTTPDTIADDGTIQNGELANSALTVAGNSVALGSSTGIAHSDLSGISSGDHHTRYSDEEAQDATGTIMAGSGATTVTYDDAGNAITISSTDTNTNAATECSGSSNYLGGDASIQLTQLLLSFARLKADDDRASRAAEASASSARSRPGVPASSSRCASCSSAAPRPPSSP